MAIFGRTQEPPSRKKTRYADRSVKTASQVSSNKRDCAAKLGVDVYVTNQILQQELDSVCRERERPAEFRSVPYQRSRSQVVPAATRLCASMYSKNLIYRTAASADHEDRRGPARL
jgi:hypothetical protein